MTETAFLELIQDPTRLMAVEHADLAVVADRYPYSANVQLLMALWAELNDHPQRERYLQRAATTTFDRSHLYDQLYRLLSRRQEPVEEEQVEDALELLSLDELEAAVPLQATTDESQPSPLLTITREEAPSAPPASYTPPAPTPAPSPTPPPAPPPRPEDPERFLQRTPIASKEELRERLAAIRKRQLALEQQKKRSVNKFARRSLVVSEGIISATLAEVFVSQGQYQHAINIYEQLALANPKKSPIFAALIKDLKHKL